MFSLQYRTRHGHYFFMTLVIRNERAQHQQHTQVKQKMGKLPHTQADGNQQRKGKLE